MKIENIMDRLQKENIQDIIILTKQMITLYQDFRIDQTRTDDHGDMLLHQWDSANGRFDYEINITRQIIRVK